MSFLIISLLFLSVYLFMLGLSMFVKNSELAEAIGRLSESRDFYAAMVPVGAFLTALGSVLLLLFQDPTNGEGIFSTLVYIAIWMVITKGLVYMFVPSCYIKPILKRFTSPKTIKIMGIIITFVGMLFVSSLINFLGTIALY